MDMHMTQMLQMTVSVFSSILIMAALALLWSKSQSSWLLIALAGAGISMLFRLGVAVMPSLYSSGGMTFAIVWSATGLMEAAGLLGYALEQSSCKD